MANEEMLEKILGAIQGVQKEVWDIAERVSHLEETKRDQEDNQIDPNIEAQVSWKLVDKIVYIVTQDVTAETWVQQLDQYSMRAKRTLPNDNTHFDTPDDAQEWINKNVSSEKQRDCFISTKTITYEL